MSLYNVQKELQKKKATGVIKCPCCSYKAMYEEALERHFQAYHTGRDKKRGKNTFKEVQREMTARERNKLFQGTAYKADLQSACLGLPHHALFTEVHRLKASTDPMVPVVDTGYWSRSTGQTSRPPCLVQPTSPPVMCSYDQQGDYSNWHTSLRSSQPKARSQPRDVRTRMLMSPPIPSVPCALPQLPDGPIMV
eukprot:TRINITY_DN5490_c0_g2_i2.p2 TRINITY_DN5490_c0_g2~~TRINITY_DN5490_c0_g2_i2.p2  ORF type:complete len:194 (+),score=20.03 TRINITY_DN5490_c0_g2_i2:36-617(+)